jgi:hypothetical protein
MNDSTYRPRNPGHDYYGRGVYLVTLVISGREPLFGHMSGISYHPFAKRANHFFLET